MTFGYGRRHSSAPPATFMIPLEALRALREAEALADAEFRQRAGRVEFRIHPGADWRPIEEAAGVRRGPIQLAALGADEENP